MTAEDKLQIACVTWFKAQYRAFDHLIAHCPNGGSRNAIEGAKLKKMGVLSGYADLQILIPNKTYHGLFIELKTDKGRQSETQKRFETEVTNQMYYYAIVRSIDEFIEVVRAYLKNKL